MEQEREMQSKCRNFKTKLGPVYINLNPVVTVLSALIIWGLMVWTIVDTDRAALQMVKGKMWITKQFTWLYVITQDVWLIFLIVIYFSKYGNLKLGRDDEEPEFGDVAYFTMLFSCGIGIRLFYFGVAEPLYHYQPGRAYGQRFWIR